MWDCLMHLGSVGISYVLAMRPPYCVVLGNSPPSLGLSFSKLAPDTASKPTVRGCRVTDTGWGHKGFERQNFYLCPPP